VKGYFYDTVYQVENNSWFYNISTKIYSGQAYEFEGEEGKFDAGKKIDMYLLCGCVENGSKPLVTYTVQEGDTLTSISSLLSSNVDDIVNLNKLPEKSFILPGWVLFVPKDSDVHLKSQQKEAARRKHHWMIVISILSVATALSVITLLIILIRRKKSPQNVKQAPKTVSKTMSAAAYRGFSLQSQFLYKENMEDMTAFESERAVIYSLEEIEEATNNFDESKIVGVGGYGIVYFGVLLGKEVAIKKMRSNKSKEFFAELKVLCKIHHINVVELLGHASGDDHLYLVYEYISNGSLGDHLHDPLLKGHQPLSWTARAKIALDSAKGIEYIHDHTKARYVHRDIKSTNILLDEGLRAKVADFGLVKLVERTSEEDLVATRLVGTPGYLPPESVKELQVTSKTDVFAFVVVLAELITGKRALARDNREPAKMKSLITILYKVFEDKDPETAVTAIIDGNLQGNYPAEDIFKMAEVAEWCLSEEAVERPEMRDIVVTLNQIVTSSIEWEASLGGNSQVFSGLLGGR
jgi:LysM repeat protein